MRTALLALLLGFAAAAPAAAADPAEVVTAAANPVTVEYYYRVRWGSMDEFQRLYRKNHEPILHEMRKSGWITRIEEQQPFTHMAGGPRWDLRVTLVYRDAEAAVGVGGAYDRAVAAVTRRLYPDKAALAAEEARRFSLLEDHWDVIVMPAGGD